MLSRLRRSAGRSIREVSAATRIPVATLGDYFNGKHLPPARDRTLERILAACGVTGEETVQAWLAARLAERAGQMRARGLPLVVTGPSGAGKSSLLRAGLIPRLGPGTQAIVFTPGPRPAQALAAALRAAGRDTGPEENTGHPGLAIIVDQFEEVFAPGVAEDERDELIEALYAAARLGPEGATLVVLGLRADRYGRALADPRLAQSLQDGQVVVGPMTVAEIQAAIVEPARKARLDLEPGLVDLMLRELRPVRASRGAHDPGALPLLSHALLATWGERRSGRLTIAGYQASGGITDAVARSADSAYGELTPGQRQAARRLFLRLVWVSDDGADARRRVALDELNGGGDAGGDGHSPGDQPGDLAAVLDLFVARRLLTSDEDTVEITHEALLTAWPQLRDWIDESRAELIVARRIIESARIWLDSGRDDGDLLRGGRLTMARDWSADPGRRPGLSAAEREFVDASFTREHAEAAEQRRATRRTRRLAGALAVALLLTAALAGYALQQRSAIGQQRNVADSRQDAAEAMNLRNQDPTVAEQLSLAAYRAARTTQARGSLLTSSAAPLAARLLGPADAVQAVALSPDHQVLAAAAAGT
ncbi:MAG TPA: helix-turn-helix domain-containing protein [Streptosporangiaceae bacterium]